MPQKFSPELEKIIIENYKNTLSLKNTAILSGVHQSGCHNVLVRNNIPRTGVSVPHYKYKINQDFFNTIDTEEKAYWLGFITADGCIIDSQKRTVLSISLSSKDKNHLDKFKKSIESQHPIGYRTQNLRGHIYTSNYFHISNKQITEDLGKLGIEPRKSFTVCPCTKIPENLIHHYWRGLFDGDGYISFSTGTTYPILGLVGNYKIVEGFNLFLNDQIGSKAKVIKDKMIYKMVYNGTNIVKKAINILYKDATIYLDRKKALADKILGE